MHAVIKHNIRSCWSFRGPVRHFTKTDTNWEKSSWEAYDTPGMPTTSPNNLPSWTLLISYIQTHFRSLGVFSTGSSRPDLPPKKALLDSLKAPQLSIKTERSLKWWSVLAQLMVMIWAECNLCNIIRAFRCDDLYTPHEYVLIRNVSYQKCVQSSIHNFQNILVCTK